MKKIIILSSLIMTSIVFAQISKEQKTKELIYVLVDDELIRSK
jgi:hypothetical protein